MECKLEPAAYWAAWADALAMLHARIPEYANQLCAELSQVEHMANEYPALSIPASLPSCLAEAEEARRLLVSEGFSECPSWDELLRGKRPPVVSPIQREVGEWAHGWQFYASRTREQRCLEFHVRPNLSRSDLALLRSQSGMHAGRFLRVLPTVLQLRIQPHILQCLLRRRLRLGIPGGLKFCPKCRKLHESAGVRTWSKVRLDIFGDHLAACTKTGRIKRRSRPLEVMWMQIFGEAGGQVVPNARLKDLRVGVDPSNKRQIEFAVYGLRLFGGIPLLCDSTQGSPFRADGNPHPRTCTEDGATCSRIEKPKNDTYSEVVRSSGWKLVTLACEVGGRWSLTCLSVVSELAKFKARQEPAHLQKAVEFAYLSRWWSLLSVSAHTAFAESLVTSDPMTIQPTSDYEPQTSTVVLDSRFEVGPAFSRLPLRG